MAKVFDYRLEAERCLEAAEKATSADNRKFLLAMARVWANLADKDDRHDLPPVPSARDSAQDRDRRMIS